MQQDYDDLEALQDEQDSSRFRWMTYVVLLLAVAGFFSLAWYAYESGSEGVREGEVMTIKADRTAMKTDPDDEGGEDFPHQDKTIYDAISSRTSEPKEETLLPEAESPSMPDGAAIQTWVKSSEGEDKHEKSAQSKPHAAKHDKKKSKERAEAELEKLEKEIVKESEDKTKLADEKSPKSVSKLLDGKKVASDANAAPDMPAPVSKASSAQKQTPPEVKPADRNVDATSADPALAKPEAVADVPPTPAPVAKPKPVTPQPVVPQTAATGSAALQLGAYQSEAEAQRLWKKISAAHADVLGGKSPAIVRAEVPGKGTYYRLRVPGYSAGAAKAACAMLSSRGQACFVEGS